MAQEMVVDTDVISFLFKESDNALFYKKTLRPIKKAMISFMTLAELNRWVLAYNWGAKKKRELNIFLEDFLLYFCDRDLCRRWAQVMETGKKKGRPISVADAWIAATALEIGCPVLTHNAKDYNMIPGLTVLSGSV